MSPQLRPANASSTQPSSESEVTGDRADYDLVQRLRAGDDRAFAEIVGSWSPMMLRVARTHVSTDASAEEIVQETWLALIHGLAAFEGRSSLRTWVFRILTNRAKTRGVREARSVPWSSVGAPDSDAPTVDPDRFRGPDDEYPHHWTNAGAPRRWEPSPESVALSGEIRRHLAAALTLLPERQRTVVTLRDINGLTSEEVCAALGITAANQRALLHRARAQLRETLQEYYRSSEDLMAP